MEEELFSVYVIAIPNDEQSYMLLTELAAVNVPEEVSRDVTYVEAEDILYRAPDIA